MKKYLLFFLLLLALKTSFGQDSGSVKFHFDQQPLNDSEWVIHIKALVALGDTLYSIEKSSDDLPFTQISFDSAAVPLLSGKPVEKGNIMNGKIAAFNNGQVKYVVDSVEWLQRVKLPAGVGGKLKGRVTYIVKHGDSFITGEQKISLTLAPDPSLARTPGVGEKQKSSLINILLIAFLAGIGTVLTPCVFPLIPVTVGFFTKRSKSRQEGLRNALLYSISIILIYTIPTFILTAFFGDSILYRISTSTAANLLFFAIFIVFAVSFFGAFEINLPSSWANKVDSKAGRGGWMGTFFMALTLVIVSFSCTGPILSSLVTGTVSQGVSYGTAGGMLAFSIGLAFPFSLFAFFPSMVHSLPRSGGWLNSVKVVFGFLELALALKFLSNADLANHWRLLDREVFLVLWVIIFVMMGLYLLGKIKFSHDSQLGYISVPRLFLAMISLSFALYMTPGLWGAPLNFLSGILPPSSTQDFNLNEIQYEVAKLNISRLGHSQANDSGAKAPQKYINLFHVPFGLTAYYDLQEALAASRALKKPIMIDFTGHSCANCRKMENEVWSKPEVLQRLQNDLVILSLYVDDKTELPDAEQYVSKAGGNLVTTIGAKNLDYEVTKFNEIAQPLYMFLDSQGEPLSNVKYGYDPGIKKFVDHIEAVKEEFRKRNP